MNISRAIEAWSRETPQALALVFGERRLSYAELDEMAGQCAAGLHALGVSAGDRVLLALPNLPEFAIAYLGAVKIGAIAVSVNPGLAPPELEFILRDCDAVVAFIGHELCALVTRFDADSPDHACDFILVGTPEASDSDCGLTFERLLASGINPHPQGLDLPPETPAALVYTSGTTGEPKGVLLSHGNVAFTVEAKRQHLGIRPDDRLLLFLPLFHCFGQNAVLLAGLHAGATLVLLPGFDPEQVLATIERERISMFFGVPTNFVVLLDRPDAERLRGVRYFFSAAAPLPLDVERTWLRRFQRLIHQGYGLTETSPFASYNHSLAYRVGSIGTPIQGVEMRVADHATGEPLPPGQSGEILVRGPNVMLGYWNRAAETAQALRDGWFHTGDIGRLDQDGYFFLEDRLKDMAIVGGFNVYPAEIERVLSTHPAVAEAAAFGLPDPVLGETLRAVVVLKAGAQTTVAELLALCQERLAEYKVPRDITFTDALPRARTGKVLKRVLRETWGTPAPAAPAPVIPAPLPDSREFAGRIVAWLSGKLAIPAAEIDRQRPFAELGMTSVLAVELAHQLACWLDRPVIATVTWNHSTIAALVAHLLPACTPADSAVDNAGSAKEATADTMNGAEDGAGDEAGNGAGDGATLDAEAAEIRELALLSDEEAERQLAQELEGIEW